MSGLERQTAIYLRGVSGARPRVPADATKLEGKARRKMSRGGVRLRQGRRRHRADRARQPGRLRPLADRAARAARRLEPRHERRALRSPLRDAVPARPDRGARAGPPGRGPGGRARGPRDRRADDPLEPGVTSDGGGRRDARPRPSALVPALLEHLERARREPRRTRRGVRLRGDRASRSTRRSSAGEAATSTSAYLPFLRGMGIAQYTSDRVFRRLLDAGGGAGNGNTPRRARP